MTSAFSGGVGYTYSTPHINVGELNIHVDDSTDTDAIKLSDIIRCYGLQQLVKSPIHRLGHTLDLTIVRSSSPFPVLPIDPPLLSDHAFITAEADCLLQLECDAADVPRLLRNWRALDVDAFTAELLCSGLVCAPPVDITEAFKFCKCSRTRKNAPLQLRRVNHRTSARWYNIACRAVKCATHSRRLCTAESLLAWCAA
jgi:hypothetical protein